MAGNIKIMDNRWHAACKLLKSSTEGNSGILARAYRETKKEGGGGAKLRGE